jgi:hypothetical protein
MAANLQNFSPLIWTLTPFVRNTDPQIVLSNHALLPGDPELFEKVPIFSIVFVFSSVLFLLFSNTLKLLKSVFSPFCTRRIVRLPFPDPKIVFLVTKASPAFNDPSFPLGR